MAGSQLIRSRKAEESCSGIPRHEARGAGDRTFNLPVPSPTALPTELPTPLFTISETFKQAVFIGGLKAPSYLWMTARDSA